MKNALWQLIFVTIGSKGGIMDQQSATSPQTNNPSAPEAAPSSGNNYKSPTPSINSEELGQAKAIIDKLTDAFNSRVVGQENLRRGLMVSLLANGHVLLESVPGLAKTTAAETLAKAVNATFHRIQCTPDLLPSDIIGTQIYDYSSGNFKTQLGPVHANFVLLDEINRSSAKTQSAMLEAMQERQTSIGGQKYPLPAPFLVLATQNPIEQEGTYELPEAQLDRFLLKEIISYPTPAEEIAILDRIESGVFDSDENLRTEISTNDVLHLQKLSSKVYLDKSIKDYIVRLVAATRDAVKVIDQNLAHYIQYGASPRASITFMSVARALALMNGRDFVIPDDVKLLRHSVLRHRIILNFEALADDIHSESIIDAIFAATQTP
jgi:MoxR-like ATPase